jgi:hypothetical protein
MNVFFDQEYDNIIKKHNDENRTNLPSLDKINKILIRYYNNNKISLDYHIHLELFLSNKLDLDQQIRLLRNCGLIDNINKLAEIFIKKMPNKSFIFNKKQNYPQNNINIRFNADDILPSGTDLNCNIDNNKGGLNYYDPEPEKSTNNYRCINAKEIIGSDDVKKTNDIDFDCGPEDKIISGIKVDLNADGKKIYEYKCSNFGELKKSHDPTDNLPIRRKHIGKADNLDKLYIRCPNDQMLRSLKVEKDTSGIKYEYECLNTLNEFKIKEYKEGEKLPTTTLTDEKNHKSCKNILKDENFECIFRPYTNQEYKHYILIFFEGKTCNTASLNRVAKFKGNIIYFSDYSLSWYKHTIDKYIAYINLKIVELNITNIILYGYSMGGYAALYASCFIDNAIVLSFNPQTFLRDNTKLSAVKSIQLFEGTGIQDLRDLLLTYTNNSKKYIFLGRSEYDDYKDEKKKDKLPKLYHDGINAGYLYNIPNTSIIIVNKNTHSSTSFIKYRSVYDLLYLKFDTIFNNLENGRELLCNDELWNDDPDFPVPFEHRSKGTGKSG